MLAVTLAVFWPNTRLTIAFVTFPLLSWAAIRATRREAHIQLFLVCAAAYAFTFSGHGPLAGNMRGVPDDLTPALFYLYVAAACLPRRTHLAHRRAAVHDDRTGDPVGHHARSDSSTRRAGP